MFPFPAATVASAQPPSILILNSYHPGYGWSDCEIEGVTGAIAAADPTVSVSIEHLDLKQFPKPGHEDRLAAFLSHKYREHRFTLAIVLDNPAFDMLRRHRDEILPGVPVVFGGVNDFRRAMLEGFEGITGVAETQDTLGTLRLALALHPGTRGIFAVHDYTSSGVAVRRELQAAVRLLGSDVEVVLSPPATYQEAAQCIAALEPGWVASAAGCWPGWAIRSTCAPARSRPWRRSGQPHGATTS